MTTTVQHGPLRIAQPLYQLVNDEILPGTGVEPAQFWLSLAEIVAELAPINAALLAHRDALQATIDQWHQARLGQPHDSAAYQRMLEQIGYLLPEPARFAITTTQVDSEMCQQAGPQLVVPVKNARFAINAANARWGSLYDALYGTDALAPVVNVAGYDAQRGQQVIQFVKEYLDQLAPLTTGSHADVVRYRLEHKQLVAELSSGAVVGLQQPRLFVGFNGTDQQPTAILLKHHGLHLELQIDPEHAIGRTDRAGMKDLLVEAAVTTIMDCEDSVAAVDAQDKVAVYRNWLGLMRGTLSATFVKGGRPVKRTLAADRAYLSPTGKPLLLPGRSLMLVRNVGHLMTTDAVIDGDGQPIPEGILDALVTAAAALHDLKGLGELRNSRSGSVYIVKPKMHGPDEVAFAVRLFARVEQALGLPENTLKIGIMDEERRTSLNLRACIQAAAARTVFINTGFLDRTGDEIHTSMHAGPMVPKGQMKSATWLAAYEQNNVAAGLACALRGKAQIGKGMWAMPDEMNAMLTEKVAHLQAGANTAWVPSPNGATLHSIHYHQVNVEAVQQHLAAQAEQTRRDEILTLPLLAEPAQLSAAELARELENNAQSILGYVVRWVSQGIGCSKVPDINDVGLMEDRATLRIASQLLANWKLHGLITDTQIIDTFKRMAVVVDEQNAHDPAYCNMADRYDDSPAFQAALDLVLHGCEQPNGYTEPLLHAYRIHVKQQDAGGSVAAG